METALLALIAIALLPVALGVTFGYLFPGRSSAKFAKLSAGLSAVLFLLIVGQYMVSIALSPDTFDDHAAAVGMMAAVPGAILLFLVLWIGALGGSALRRRVSGASET